MSKIDDVFKALRAKNQRALMPFLTAGDPDLATTAAVLQELVKRRHRGARTVIRLLENPTNFLSTVQVGITLVGVFAAAYSGATLTEVLMSLLIMSIGVVSGVWVFPLSNLGALQANQITNSKFAEQNATASARQPVIETAAVTQRRAFGGAPGATAPAR